MKEPKKITFKRNANGDIVGVEVVEHLTLEELERHYPRKDYPRQWTLLDQNLPADL